MMASSTEEKKQNIAADYASLELSSGSINAEPFEVQIADASHRSVQSRASFSPEELAEMQRKFNRKETARYFALKDGYFERAVEYSKSEVYVPDVDGSFIGAWLATEIDHWDNEKERLLLLTQKQLIVIRYNFITTKVEDYRKIPLVNCTRIQCGRLAYSKATFDFYQQSTHRNEQVGLRVHWNAVKVPGAFDFWNPWSRDIPHLTLTEHISVCYNEDPPECVSFSAFQKSLIAAASSDISRSLVTDEEPIVINMILGITALVHNQSKLGFSRERGGVCY